MVSGTTQIPFDYGEVTRDDDAFYDGYWQNEKNFLPIRDKVIKAYTFPKFQDERNARLAEKLKMTRAVSCHVRRGRLCSLIGTKEERVFETCNLCLCATIILLQTAVSLGGEHG